MTDLAAIGDELRRSPVPLAKWLPSGKAAHLTDEDYDWIARKLAVLLADTPSVEPLEAALWECYVQSGADTDGDSGPGAWIAGMGEAGFARAVVEAVKQLRTDYNEVLDTWRPTQASDSPEKT